MRLPVVLIGSRLLTGGLGLIQLMALTRFLSPEQFGVSALCIAAASYVCLLGEPPIVAYERLGAHDERSNLIEDKVRLAAQSALTVTGLLLLTLGVIWGLVTSGGAAGAAVSVWAISLIQLRWTSVQVLNWGRRGIFASILVTNSIARVVGTAVAAWFSASGSLSLIAGGVGSIIVTALVSPPFASWKWHTSEMKSIFRLGVPASIPAFAAAGLIAWPTFAAQQLLPADEFAAFAAQFSLATAISSATTGFLVVFGFPVVKRQWDSGAKSEAMSRAARYLLQVGGLSLGLALLALVFGNWLTGLVISRAYAGNLCLTVSLLAFGLFFVARPPGWILRLEYRQKLLGVLALLAALVQMPAVWLGTSIGGVRGLLLAFVAVFLLQAELNIWVAMGRRAWSLQPVPLILAVSSVAVIGFAATSM